MRASLIDDLFWSKIEVRSSDECWPWKACLDKKGYGKWSTGPSYGLSTKSHRVAWQLKKGTIPSGIYVCHVCDNPSCCNPDHLWLGTALDNTRDMMKKGRYTQHKLTAKEVEEIRTSGDSQRSCAKRFGVCHSTIGRIRKGLIWGEWHGA
jgi:hypothetical protein